LFGKRYDFSDGDPLCSAISHITAGIIVGAFLWLPTRYQPSTTTREGYFGARLDLGFNCRNIGAAIQMPLPLL